MLIKIHDLPTKYPMDGLSFHVKSTHYTLDPVHSLSWNDGVLELVLESGEVWRLNFEDGQWEHTETLSGRPE